MVKAMLSFFFALIFSQLSHAKHPLCPFDAASARAAMAPAARAEMRGLDSFFADFKVRFGKCLSVAKKEDWVLRYEGAEIPFRIAKDKRQRWRSVSFGPAEYPGDTAARLSADAAAAGAALWVGEENTAAALVGREEAAPMEVGEAAHLLWLAEYRRRIKAGSLTAASVVATRPNGEVQSLGPLLSWPAGVPLTLESLALLAFRSRDNVAGDLLLEGLGGMVGEKLVSPYVQLAQGEPEKIKGWRHSVKDLCSAALSLKEDAAFPSGVNGAVGMHRFFEFTGEFPRTLNITQLWQREAAGPWACASITIPNPSEIAFTRARDFLDRGAELIQKKPAGRAKSAGKEG
ncbi:MAG: hypothetical protein EOP11_00335 [Proteobacteria bacterium]|nr:MAG: hypothetical protein EOP11_00335 [Pseudomonadota bacterium]